MQNMCLQKNLGFFAGAWLFGYLLLSASCLQSVIFSPSFFLISCEGANYPAAYQLKTMPGAKGASIICEQRAKAAGTIIKDAGASS